MKKLIVTLMMLAFALTAVPALATADDMTTVRKQVVEAVADVDKVDALSSRLQASSAKDLASAASNLASKAKAARDAATRAKLDKKLIVALDGLASSAVKLDGLMGDAVKTGKFDKVTLKAIATAAADVESRFEAVAGLMEPIVSR